MEYNWSLFDELDQPKVEKDDHSLCCGSETTLIDSNRTCLTCGNSVEQFIYIVQSSSSFLKHRYLYKRKSYFKTLLHLYSCNKLSTSSNYNKSLEILRNEKFENILELRKIMKKNRLNKLYNAIYLLFFDIKKVKLIPLTRREIDQLVYHFLKIERYFKKNKNGRIAIYSYNLIINRLLKHLDYPFFDYIPVPVSNLKMVDDFDKILKLII